MNIKQILESVSAAGMSTGSVATVSAPLGKVQKRNKDMEEGHDANGFHSSIEQGKFLPSKFGNKRYVYLHDLENQSPSTGGPQLVTVDDANVAKQLADKFGGKVVKTNLDTFRIVQPNRQGVAEVSDDNRQWSNKEEEKFRRSVADIDSMFSKDDAWTKTKQKQIKQQIKTKPMAGPKGQLPEQGVAEAMSPQQQHDFDRMRAGAMSRQEYDAKWRKKRKSDDEVIYGKRKGVAEGFNPEYDDEAGMADNNLETLSRAVEGIDELIQSGDNLPEWCQEKIAVAKSMLVAVWDYMKSEEERRIAEGLKDPKDNPCWKGYKPVGTKKKNGRTVPNCVPSESVEENKKGVRAVKHTAKPKGIEPPKPRNFVAKNAKMGGAGQHKDKKKAAKQGDVKHKSKEPAYESKLWSALEHKIVR